MKGSPDGAVEPVRHRQETLDRGFAQPKETLSRSLLTLTRSLLKKETDTGPELCSAHWPVTAGALLLSR